MSYLSVTVAETVLCSMHFHSLWMFKFQVIVSDINTQYIENVIFIMKVIMENYDSEKGGEHLGQATIEPLMLAIVRYCMIIFERCLLHFLAGTMSYVTLINRL